MPFADNLGTLRDIADFNETTLAATVTNHRTFNANGKLVAETNAAVDLLYAFTGKQLDDSTGLQHNLFRWYDANLGQWLSEDPLGFSAGDENVRRYVGNRATMKVDRMGLEDPSLIQLVPPRNGWPSPLPGLFTHTDAGKYWTEEEVRILQLFGATKNANPLPKPSLETGWHYNGAPVDWKENTLVYLKSTSFSAENAEKTAGFGCGYLASFRLGFNGELIQDQDGVQRFLTLDEAWEHLEHGVADGKNMRLAIMQSINFPLGYNSVQLGKVPEGRLAPMFAMYDYAVLHWDHAQEQYYWESINNARGALWRASKPLNKSTCTIYFVIEITQMRRIYAQGLPTVP